MSGRRVLAILFLGLLPLVGVLGQGTSLVAMVDRDQIRANESFTYVLRAEGRISGRPDLSVLTRDFDLLQSGSASNIQIVNGQTTQIAEWTVELMPRETGTYELPSVELGGVLSNAVNLEILPPEMATEAGADIFIEAELDRTEAYVQAQAIYTLRLFVGIATGREVLTTPPVEGGEAIIEKLGGDREYQTVRGDRVYRVRERKFAIFPQTTGTLSIGPAQYEATVIPGLGFSRRQGLSSNVVELSVRPAVAPPSSHPDAVWLPARELRIDEVWSTGSPIFQQGVPRTRELSIVADGLLETQLPELRLTEAQGLRQYADQPELGREIMADSIEARRTERFAVIAQQPGPVEFPPVELPWWNVDEERWEIARIESVTIEVEPGDAARPSTPQATLAEPSVVVQPDRGFWPWLTGLLAVGWVATIVAWASSKRVRRRIDAKPAASKAASPRALMKQLLAACRVDDAERARDLLLEWAAHQLPDDPPSSLGALAARLSGSLADEIAVLESTLYGPEGSPWQGQRLADLLKTTQSVSLSAPEAGQDPLVPLYR